MTSTTAVPAATAPRQLDLLPVAVGFYAAAAAVVSPVVYANMVQHYLVQLQVFPPLLILGLAVAGPLMRPRSPLSMIRDIVVRSGPRLLLVTALLCIGLAGFTTFKIAIPLLVPFHLDPLLADIDAVLHFGNPGQWAHLMVPEWAQYPLGYLYGKVWFVLWFGCLALVACSQDRALRRRYFWSFALSILLLGTILATLSASVGPVFYAEFYASDRFGTLMDKVWASAAGDYMRDISGYLLDNFRGANSAAGTGISAMPSMHLAIVTLNALLMGRFNRWLGLAGWVYVGLVLLGSVYLGWHYAIDGYVSIAVVALIWWAVPKLLPLPRILEPETDPAGDVSR